MMSEPRQDRGVLQKRGAECRAAALEAQSWGSHHCRGRPWEGLEGALSLLPFLVTGHVAVLKHRSKIPSKSLGWGQG